MRRDVLGEQTGVSRHWNREIQREVQTGQKAVTSDFTPLRRRGLLPPMTRPSGRPFDRDRSVGEIGPSDAGRTSDCGRRLGCVGVCGNRRAWQFSPFLRFRRREIEPLRRRGGIQAGIWLSVAAK